MCPDRVSNPGPLALESDALPTALPVTCDVNALAELHMLKIFLLNQDSCGIRNYIIYVH